MAVYKLFPLQDATIYSFYRYMNTGIDPIIEAGNLNVNINPVPQVFRFLVEFDQNEINSVIDNTIGNVQFSSSLRCYIANAQGVDHDSCLEVYPISGSWRNGTGTYLDVPITTNGCSWVSRTFSGSGGEDWDLATSTAYVTASWSGSDNQGGGNWYTGSLDTNANIEVSQCFTLRSEKDLNAPVTDIVKTWYSSSKGIAGTYTNIVNDGFIVKWEDTIEFSTSDAIQPVMQFYSVDTNTIYPPQLELKWDDQVFETGNLPAIATTDFYAALDSNPGVFYSESINRFRINVRPDFPTRTFLTSSLDTQNHYLNSSSMYSVKDLDTNETLIDFDPEFTKISCDSQSNYFDIYMNGLQPERYYKILIQTTISGSTIIKDDNYYFKVVNR
jgi:hypothetical protein|tara:strand:- start:446 stop:1603 length:1158 start_codon:yes stop_codon:yes gene_type:complete